MRLEDSVKIASVKDTAEQYVYALYDNNRYSDDNEGRTFLYAFNEEEAAKAYALARFYHADEYEIEKEKVLGPEDVKQMLQRMNYGFARPDLAAINFNPETVPNVLPKGYEPPANWKDMDTK